MSQIAPEYSRSVQRGRSLLLSASALALIAFAAGGIARAQTVDLTSANSPLQLDGGTATQVNITSGSTVALFPQGQEWILGSGQPLAGNPGLNYSSQTLSSASGLSSALQGGSVAAATINIQAGGTLFIVGNSVLGWDPWAIFNSMIGGQGNILFGNNGGGSFDGTNAIGGNFTMLAGTTLNTSENWKSAGQFNVGGNFIMGSGSTWNDYNDPTLTDTIGGYLSSADNSAAVNIHSGTLLVNGQNTAAAPFTGVLTISPGATFVVGDAAHPNAVFGDPGHPDGSTETISVTRSSSGTAVLKGYGTIYGTVSNPSGVVQPGGTKGVPGTLTVSRYVQGATGTLTVEVSPTGASRLKVLGSASLAGTLNIAIDPGTYGTSVSPILSAGAISGGFSSIITTGNAAGAIAGLAITPTGYEVVTESAAGAQIFGHMLSANRDNINAFTRSLYDKIEMNSPVAGADKADFGNGFSAWLEPEGRLSRVSHGDISYHTGDAGVIGGIEHRSDRDTVFGVAAAYANESLNTQGGQTTGSTNTYDVAAYAGTDLLNFRIDGDLYYNSYTGSTTRDLGSAGVAQSSPGGDAYGASLQISRGIYDNLVVPYLRGTYTYNRQQSTRESGAGPLALQLNAIDEDFFVGDFGVRIHPLLPLVNGAALRPEITLAIEHDFSKAGEQVIGQFATITSAPFTWSWKGNQTTSAVAGLSLASAITKEFEVYGKIDGRFSSFQQEGSLMVGARYRF